MFYHKKEYFYSKEKNGYKEKITICLHNGAMSPNKDGDITYTILEHITRYSSGRAVAFDNVHALLAYVLERGYRFNTKSILEFDNILKEF